MAPATSAESIRKAFPAEFHADVVAVARKREAPLSQIAKDFGISEATLHAWLKKDDVETGVRPGLTEADAKELREYKNRVRLLEQENEILRRAARDHYRSTRWLRTWLTRASPTR
jgi:transposase